MSESHAAEFPPDAIAIVGMAGRFPGAVDVPALWELLCAGRAGLQPLSAAELQAAGVAPAEYQQKNYVRMSGGIAHYDCFDAGFFGINPREAAVLDPQHRVFFECAWAALESAAIDPGRFAGSIGVFAGASLNTYLLYNVAANPTVLEQVGVFGAAIASDKDALTQRLSYLLDLKGPAITVQTACSTSLVAVQQACQSLQNFQCDAALAGGVSIKVPHAAGYRHTEGGVSSPDGHCRPFDAAARGTVPASGCGVVLLRRLEDALADGDPIVAVIRGAAVNNDGAQKVGFTAPAVAGQAEVIALAQAAADVEPISIGYLEAHGTATPLGDPIEVAALAQAFGAGASCQLGSIKSNLGHLDAAAGVAGLIKAALIVREGQIPPTLHFKTPNPEAGLEAAGFRVNATLMDWPASAQPRRAGVSSFGIGGTNAHVVVEAPPSLGVPPAAAGPQWLPLAARTPEALARQRAQLAAWLAQPPVGTQLADVATTLQRGRRAWAERWLVRVDSIEAAVAALESGTEADPATLPAELRAWREGTTAAWPESVLAGGRRMALPTYPFARDRHWIEAAPAAVPAARSTERGPEFQQLAWRRGGRGGTPELMLTLADESFPAVVSTLAQAVAGGARRLGVAFDRAARADLLALAGVIPSLQREVPDLDIQMMDTEGRTWLPRWSTVPVAMVEAKPVWRERGVYVITGGFGRLGLALAEELAQGWQARLVLLGRRGAAAAPERVAALEAAGAEVMAVAADVADAAAMRRMLDDVVQRWGAVHGVVHAAGLTGAESVVPALGETTAAQIELLCRAKLEGWRALAAATAERELDFRVAISSLVTVVGGAGLAAYAAANAAMDAAIEAEASSGWISIAWGAVGAGAELNGAVGRDVIERLVARGEPGVWAVTLRGTASAGQPAAPVAAEKPAWSRAETERRLAGLWEEAVGQAPASLQQNFFEAGGDSLIAVQLVARINHTFGAELSVAAFLDAPTVAEVAGKLTPPATSPAPRTAATDEGADVVPVRRGARRRRLRELERGGES